MAILEGFDASKVEPNQSFEAIPSGEYLCTITASEMKPTKDGQNKGLNFTITVQEGPYRGRLLWERLYLDHKNEDAARISKGKLSAICRAVGVLRPKDSMELHNIPFIAKVGAKKKQNPNDPNEELQNEIKAYKPRSAAARTAPTQQQAPTTAPAAAPAGDASVPPWRKS